MTQSVPFGVSLVTSKPKIMQLPSEGTAFVKVRVSAYSYNMIQLLLLPIMLKSLLSACSIVVVMFQKKKKRREKLVV